MTSCFHILKNAKTVGRQTAESDRTVDATLEQALGEATLTFRFREDIPLSAMRAMHDRLNRNGWEEQVDESALGDELVYEWSYKDNLTGQDC